MTVLTDETWFPSIEEGIPDAEIEALRRELFIRRRKEVRQTPRVWQRLAVLRTRSDAAYLVRGINSGKHPLFRSRIGAFRAEYLFNLVYIVYRDEPPPSQDYCNDCDHDTHICKGCGEHHPHGEPPSCDDCKENT